MADLGKAYVQIIPSADGIENSIANAIGAGVDKAEKKEGGIGSALAKGATAGLKATGVALGAAATAIGAIGQQAVSAYGEFEQLQGGIEKLYGEGADYVMQNASRAFETAGMSANEYMDTATQFAASIMATTDSSLEAAELTDIAMRSMSDNVNTFGSDMESVSNAYKGFSKANYTMLDNLKLGYGGTKQEMERLIADANVYAASIGEASDLSIDSFADIVTAIELIQQKQNIAGTTSKEAASTIQGSLTMTQKAWENLVTGMADENADLGALIGDLANSASAALSNLVPVITTTITQIGQSLVQIMPAIMESLPTIISETLPALLDAAAQMLSMLLQGVRDNVELVTQMALEIVNSLVTFISENLPLLIETALIIITTLANGIAESIPEMVPTIVEIVLQIVDTLLNNLPMLIMAALQIIEALASGLVEQMPRIFNATIQIIKSITSTIISNLPQILASALQIMMSLGAGLINNIQIIIAAIPSIISAIVSGLINGISEIAAVGGQLVSGLWNGISDKIGWVQDQIWGMGSSIISTIKGVFGIHSPSREFAWIGQMLDEGLANGISDNVDIVDDAMGDVYDSVHTPLGSFTATGSAAFQNGGAVAVSGGAGGDIIIPVYIGQSRIDELVVKASQVANYRSGGR